MSIVTKLYYRIEIQDMDERYRDPVTLDWKSPELRKQFVKDLRNMRQDAEMAGIQHEHMTDMKAAEKSLKAMYKLKSMRGINLKIARYFFARPSK